MPNSKDTDRLMRIIRERAQCEEMVKACIKKLPVGSHNVEVCFKNE